MADRGRGRGPPPGSSRGPPSRGRGPRADRGDSRGRGGSPARGRGGPPQRGGSPSGASSSTGSGVSGPVYNVSGGPLPTPSTRASDNEDAVARALVQSRPALHPIVKEAQDMTKSKGDVDSLVKRMANVSVEEMSPYRPAYGTNGKPVRLWTNYMELQIPQQASWHRYAIRVSDSYQRKSRDNAQWETVARTVPNPKKRRVIHLYLHDTFFSKGTKLATDYSGLVMSPAPLPNVPDDDEIREQVIYRPEENDEVPEESGQILYTIVLKKIDTLSTSDLFKAIMSTQAAVQTGQKADVIQAANIIVNHWARTAAFDPEEMMINLSKFCQNPASAARGFDLGAGLRALRGFATSVRPGAARMLLNVQVKNVAIYPNIPLSELMQEYLQAHPRNFRALESFLRKIRVSLIHLKSGKKNAINGKPRRRVKMIMALAHTSDGSREKQVDVRSYAADAYGVSFSTDDGRKMTVAEHFSKTYNINCVRGLPVVNCGSATVPVYIPPDVCHVEPAQPPAARLSPDQTANMIRFAVRKPYENATTIARDAPRKLKLNSTEDAANPVMDAFGIQTSSQLITVPARILQSPNILYANRKTARVFGGRWNMKDITFSQGRTVGLWAVMWISGSRPSRVPMAEMAGAVTDFIGELNRNGVHIREPESRRQWKVPNDADQYQFFKAQIQTDILTLPKRPDVVLFALSEANTLWYNHIKSLADCTFGFHSVCVVDTKFARNRNGQYNRQYFANVALKFNLKLKGRNQVLDPNKLGIIAQGKTMLVGIDVTHPSATSSSEAPSVAGSVATIDSAAVQYLPSLYVQRGRQEMVANLDGMFKRHLNNWKNANKGQLPENILIYRDGVSEGQYRLVLERELPEIRRSCFQIYSGKQPKLTIVVVGKRHQTRFYPTSSEADVMDQKSYNPLNGTVVDRGVTEPRNWDFFLQSHTALQGTARPAHYYVVIDEIFSARKPLPPFKNHADELEDLTHNLCYLFGRATMAVSICPPAYYADLVCERARRYLSNLYEPPTPTGSQSGSVSGGQTNLGDLASEGEFKINPALQDSMFYV